ncbi:MFS transporter [Bradyrhizobium sp.]|uniref:MFS transporter n=1 Tax=Bradyrhizobium sp. TaxID=376 RepID=UPI0039E63909
MRGVDKSEDQRATLTGWAGVGSVAAGTFLLVTTEFLPIGLLSPLAADMQVSEGVAGLSVTAPGFVAAFAAPLLTMLARDADRRIVVLALTAAIVVSNLIGALAPNFAVFLVGRLVLGLAVGGLWSFAVAVGRRLVPESAGARATSIISLGISAGTVFGMPVGAVVGDWAGWRMVFAANVVLGLAILLVQLAFLPRLPTTIPIDIGRLIAFAKVPMARVGLLASAFVAGGHFIAYTFLEPYLRDTLGLTQDGVALALAGYAVTGIAGAFAGERFAVRDIRSAIAVSAAAVGLTVIAAATTTGAPAIIMVMAWGFAFGAVPVCVQIWMFTSSPRLYEAGSALMVSAFQIALSAGAAIGGLLVDTSGIGSAFLTGGAVCIAGALIPLALRSRVASPAPVPCTSGDIP